MFVVSWISAYGLKFWQTSGGGIAASPDVFQNRPKAVPPGTEQMPPVLNINSDNQYFRKQVTDALGLIWNIDNGETYNSMIRDKISEIRYDDKTGFDIIDGKYIISISPEHAFRSVTWCAGIIMHQAWHAWYKRQQSGAGKRVPPKPGQKSNFDYDINPLKTEIVSLDDIFAVEARASAFQLKILQLVGAPASETDLLENRDYKDLSTGHDGSFKLKP